MSDLAAGRALQSGGGLVPGRHLYIVRPEDERLFELLRDGEFCNLLSPRQVGKTSLMNRVVLRLRAAGIDCAAFDIGQIGRFDHDGTPIEPSDWYASLISRIADELGLDLDAESWWHSQTGTINERLLRFFRDEVADREGRRAVICLDEIDATLELPFTDDLFRIIRAMYNERALAPAYERLAFCLIGVATPNELIKHRRSTAYNVGTTIALQDFDRERHDLSQLDAAFGDPARGRAIVDEVLAWTGGQPFLTQRICGELLADRGADAAELDREAVRAHVEANFRSLESLSNDTHFEPILRFFDERVSDPARTLELYTRVRSGERVADRAAEPQIQLKLAGLVKRGPDGMLRVRNRIYERLFDLDWVESTAPRRQLARYRRFAAAALAIMLVLLAVLAYTQYIMGPAREQLAVLAADSSEEAAAGAFAVLVGRSEVADRSLPLVGPYRLFGYHQAGVAAYKAYWERRAQALDELAAQQLDEGDLDEALLLGALASVKRHGPVEPGILEVYRSRGFAHLVRTIRVGLFLGGDVAASPDGSRLAVGTTSPDDAMIFEVATGKMALGVEALRSPVIEAVAFSPDGSLLATGGYDNLAHIWNARSGDLLQELGGHESSVNAVVFSPDGALFATGGDGATLWDASTWRRIARLRHAIFISSVAFSHDSRWLATASAIDGLVKIWDAAGLEVRTIDSLSSGVHDVEFSPVAPLLAGGGPGRVQLWNAGSGDELRVFEIDGDVRGVGFSPDGQWIAAASAGGQVLIWEVESGRELLRLEPADAGGVHDVTFVSRTDLLATLAPASDQLRVWTLAALRRPEAAVDPATEDPHQRWRRWQLQLGLTADDDGRVEELRDREPQTATGWDPSLEAAH